MLSAFVSQHGVSCFHPAGCFFQFLNKKLKVSQHHHSKTAVLHLHQRFIKQKGKSRSNRFPSRHDWLQLKADPPPTSSFDFILKRWCTCFYFWEELLLGLTQFIKKSEILIQAALQLFLQDNTTVALSCSEPEKQRTTKLLFFLPLFSKLPPLWWPPHPDRSTLCWLSKTGWSNVAGSVGPECDKRWRMLPFL